MADKEGTAAEAPKKEEVAKDEKPKDEKNKDEKDLTDILNVKERTSLTLLLANATEAMRQNIVDNFDATATLDMGLLDESQSEEDKFNNANIDPATADVEKYDQERKLKADREKEISTKAMQKLKGSALKAYDGWREEVIQRVGEVVNNRETAQQQQSEAKSEPRPPAPSRTVSALGKEEDKSTSLHDLFPPIKTPLLKLDTEKRQLILHSLLLLFLSLEHYSAPSRILLLYVASSLHLPVEMLSKDEAKVAQGLMEAAKHMSGDEEIQKKAEANKDSRKWKVGIASVAGAAIVGITGGMAAPLVAAGVGTVMGGLGLGTTAAAGYLGAVAGSTYVVGGLFGAYGGRMTGQMMDNFARDVEDFSFQPVHGPKKSIEDAKKASSEDRRLKVTVGISGWLTEKEEVVKPWRVLGHGAEVFALRWELEALMNLGHSMNELVTSAAWGYAQKEVIKRTIFADLMGAMWPIGLLKVARLVDNPFSVAKTRAEKAGEVLADALIHKAQGERTVTLIGYSLGARVIYSCLMTLAKREVFGLVESVVLMGAPVPSDTREWRIMRTAVSGRLVNVYSENDYILGFLYRTSSIQYGIAGLQKIEGLPGVENIDVSDTISGHLRYRYLVGNILQKIGFEDIDMEEVKREEEELKKMEEEEKKKSLARQMHFKKEHGEADKVDTNSKETDELEKSAKAKTDQSMMEWAYEQLTLAGISRGVSTLSNIATDPEKAASAASSGLDSVNATYNDLSKGKVDTDVQNTHLTYLQRAYAYLPAMSGTLGGKEKAAVEGAAGKATEKAAIGDTAGKATEKAPDVPADVPQTGSRSYLARAYASLPEMPHMVGSGSPEQTPRKGEVKADAPQQSYLSMASSYIPSLGYGSKASPEAAPAKAGTEATEDAEKEISSATEGAEKEIPSATKREEKETPAATEDVEEETSVAKENVPSTGSVSASDSAPAEEGTNTAKDTPAAPRRKAPKLGPKGEWAAKKAAKE